MGRLRINSLLGYQAMVLAAAVVTGMLAAVEPRLALAAVIGLAFAMIVFADLAVGVCLFVVVAYVEPAIPQELGPLSMSKVAGGLLVISWFASVALRRSSRSLTQDQPLLVALLAVIGTLAVISAIWAREPGAALDESQRWILNLALFPIAYTAIEKPRHLEWFFAICVLGSVFHIIGGGLGIFEPAEDDFLGDSEGRLAGAGINPNQLGGLLVCATVFAAALGARPGLPGTPRLIWWSLAAAVAAALAATLSRGSLLGMGACMLVAPFLMQRRRRLPALVASVLAAAAVTLSILALIPSTASDRLTASDNTGSGRTDLWRVGLRMVADRPILGVGAGNFRHESLNYLVQPGVLRRDDVVIETPKGPHNVYLHVLAELGLVGLLLFGALIAGCLAAAHRAAGLFARAGRRGEELMARALLIALVGFLAAMFFSSQTYSKQLWLMLALCWCLLGTARAVSRLPRTPGRLLPSRDSSSRARSDTRS